MHRVTIDLPTEADTATLAARLAAVCNGTETILISGPVGAGKSALARAIIQTLTSPSEEVPSPTFTLVQTYEASEFDIFHADLYRLARTSEIDELGLLDVFGRVLSLVEWPDRLGEAAPEDALRIELGMKGDGRVAFLSTASSHWDSLFVRENVR